MCGRFVSTAGPDRIAAYFDSVLPTEVSEAIEPFAENFNVAPTQDVYAVVAAASGASARVRRDHVDVGVRHLVAGDDHADPLGREREFVRCAWAMRMSEPDRVRHREQVGGELGGRRPSGRSPRSAPPGCAVRHRVDRHERDAVLVAPHERARDVALDDAGEDGRHGRTLCSPAMGEQPETNQRRREPGSTASAIGRHDVDDPEPFTLIRLLCLPLFLWLLFGLPSRQAAAWLLGALGATDWVDGYLARRLGQTSEFGKKFDPTVDRLLFVVGIVGIIVNDGDAALVRHRRARPRGRSSAAPIAIATLLFGMERFDVTWWGKTATFLLMFAVPGFLMGNSRHPDRRRIRVAAWCFGIPGLVLSYYTAIAYIPMIRDAVRTIRGVVTAEP
jgi:cardiolipin synthase (CMP-forming)